MIDEQGTHEELLKINGRYKNLISEQRIDENENKAKIFKFNLKKNLTEMIQILSKIQFNFYNYYI